MDEPEVNMEDVERAAEHLDIDDLRRWLADADEESTFYNVPVWDEDDSAAKDAMMSDSRARWEEDFDGTEYDLLLEIVQREGMAGAIRTLHGIKSR